MTLATVIVFLAAFLLCTVVQHRGHRRSREAQKDIALTSARIVKRLSNSGQSPPVTAVFSSDSYPPGIG